MKKIFIMIIIISIMIVLSGCNSIAGEDMDESEYIHELDDGVVYDERTNIVYYFNMVYYGYEVLTPFYGEDKEIVTREEYLSKYKK